MDSCTLTRNPRSTREPGILLHAKLNVCNDLLVVRLRLNLESTCFTQLQEKFKKKLVFLVARKSRMLQDRDAHRWHQDLIVGIFP
jgi:hypothetical protein